MQFCELIKNTVLLPNIKQFYAYVEIVNLFAEIKQFPYLLACFSVFGTVRCGWLPGCV